MDTIYAEATPPGRGGVSIIRISGPLARSAAEALAGPLPQARHATYRVLREGGEELDRALVVVFDEGASFTGEASAELHLHGAPVVVARVLRALSSIGLKPAEAGEFTRRAFENGRIDLSQAEGFADLLAAETEAQRRQAMQAAGGALRKRAEAWRSALVRAGALIEASIDFADEDVPEDVPQEVYALLARLSAELSQEIEGYPAAERVRQGFEVAVIGPPNSGKSSFINRLARRDVALVSERAGTTRDVIELRIELGGMAVTLLDTAGMRATTDDVEAMGIDRARQRAEAADLRLHLFEDGSRNEELYRPDDIVVRTKGDLPGGGGLAISSVTGDGIADLVEVLRDRLSARVAGASLASHQRQADALRAARSPLNGIEALPPEVLAESVRQSATALDTLVGKIGAEDYLDVIFSSFCIGK